MYKSLVSIILLLTFIGKPALPQMHLIDKDANSFSLPFKISQNLMIIPVWINGSGRLNMILDTGISNTIVTEIFNADTLSLNHAREVSVAGLGAGEAIHAYQSSNNHIRLGLPDDSESGIEGDGFDVFILMEDQFDLSSQLGIPVNGLIGNDVLQHFLIEIDPVAHWITFWDPAQFNIKRKRRNFSEIPIEVEGGKAHMNVILKQTDGSRISTRLLIDSGASLAMWISPSTDPLIKIPQTTIPAFLGQGLNGEINGVNGRIPEIIIGPFSFKNPIISYPDSTSVMIFSLGEERNGSIGNDIFRRFKSIIDYENYKLYLKPNKWFKDSFTYNRSGMEVDKPMGKLPYFRVFNVVEESPAALAGIMTGDQLISINYINDNRLSLDDINSILHGNSGNTVRVEVLRNGEKIKVKFKLGEAI